MGRVPSLNNGGIQTDPAIQDLGAATLTQIAALNASIAVVKEAPINVDYPEYGGDVEAALTAAGTAGIGTGAEVFIPPGNRAPTAAYTIPNGVHVFGAGPSTRINCAGNWFAFAFTGGNRSRISNLYISASSPQTAAGGGIDFTGAQYNIDVDHIYLGANLYTGLKLTPSAQGGIWFIDRIRWNGVTGCNTAIEIGDGTNLLSDVVLSRLSGTAATNTDMVNWIYQRTSTDTIIFNECEFVKGTNGALIAQTAVSGLVTGSRMRNVLFDTMSAAGVQIDNARDFEFLDCSLQDLGTTSTPAARIGGTNTQAVRWRGGIFQQNQGDGLVISTGAAKTLVHGVTFANNNTFNAAGKAGVSVAANVGKFQVLGCTIGNDLTGTGVAAGHHKYGVVVAAGTSDNYIVTNNTISVETTAVSDGGTGTNKIITGNI